ncbi:extracellular metalloprotease [Xylariaceae sp. FL1019]|nr:extracellular metalloprotease [Xylariaceae sp. FL1019]
MRSLGVVVFLVCASVTARPPASLHGSTASFACGIPPPTEQHLDTHAMLMQMEQSDSAASCTVIAPVNVYFHIVTSKEMTEDRMMNERIKQQMEVLNDEYNPHGTKFKMAGITKTVYAAWAENNGSHDMMAAMRKGTYQDLNVYVQESLGGSAAGLCPYPGSTSGPQDYIGDGCQIVAASLPGGGKYTGLNDGKAAVHEVGHWFGLLHTFENGCEPPGDWIDDTPFEKSAPTSGCPTGLSSCNGTDPIHNHMDYTSGTCKTSFTPGQQMRMHSQWKMFRAGK